MTIEQLAALDEGIYNARALPDGRYAWIHPLAFTWAICVATPRSAETGYDDRWCYHDYGAALRAIDAWDGTGEPQGWHRHPSSGRRRPDGDAAREYVHW